MKISGLFIAVLLASLIVALLTDGVDAARRRKNKKGRGRKKSSGKKQATKLPKHIFVSPLQCNDSNSCCDDSRPGRAGEDEEEGEKRVNVEDTVNTTLKQLEILNWDLQALLGEIGSVRNMGRMLGQTIWWVNWIRASLGVLEQVGKRFDSHTPLVPAHRDRHTGNTVTLPRVLGSVRKLQTSLVMLWKYEVKLTPTAKGKDPLRCQKVKITPVCARNELMCSGERDRAFLILRDAHRAAIRMNGVWTKVRDDVMAGASLADEEVMGLTVFYECVLKSCDLQKRGRCKQCLSWTTPSF
ncbi:hypothetical protein ACOMHN_035979 [Nucella lapillus]